MLAKKLEISNFLFAVILKVCFGKLIPIKLITVCTNLQLIARDSPFFAYIPKKLFAYTFDPQTQSY